jgi:hypothetical protein
MGFPKLVDPESWKKRFRKLWNASQEHKKHRKLRKYQKKKTDWKKGKIEHIQNLGRFLQIVNKIKKLKGSRIFSSLAREGNGQIGQREICFRKDEKRKV